MAQKLTFLPLARMSKQNEANAVHYNAKCSKHVVPRSDFVHDEVRVTVLRFVSFLTPKCVLTREFRHEPVFEHNFFDFALSGSEKVFAGEDVN